MKSNFIGILFFGDGIVVVLLCGEKVDCRILKLKFMLMIMDF